MRSVPRCLASAVSLVLVGVLLALPRSAHAYPVLLWTGLPTQEGTGIVFPFLFSSGDARNFSPSLYGALGLSQRFDIIGGVSGNFARSPASASFGQVDLSPRFLATPELALSPRIIYTPGHSLMLSPEVHATRSFGDLMLTVNAGIRPLLDLHGGGLTSTTAFLYASSSYFVSKQLWFVLEADPSLSFVRATETTNSSRVTSVTVAPGVGFALSPEQTHIFELAALIAVPTSSANSFTYAGSVTYALWYATPFELWKP